MRLAPGGAMAWLSRVYLDSKPIAPSAVMFVAWMDNPDGQAVFKSNWPPQPRQECKHAGITIWRIDQWVLTLDPPTAMGSKVEQKRHRI